MGSRGGRWRSRRVAGEAAAAEEDEVGPGGGGGLRVEVGTVVVPEEEVNGTETGLRTVPHLVTGTVVVVVVVVVNVQGAGPRGAHLHDPRLVGMTVGMTITVAAVIKSVEGEKTNPADGKTAHPWRIETIRTDDLPPGGGDPSHLLRVIKRGAQGIATTEIGTGPDHARCRGRRPAQTNEEPKPPL